MRCSHHKPRLVNRFNPVLFTFVVLPLFAVAGPDTTVQAFHPFSTDVEDALPLHYDMALIKYRGRKYDEAVEHFEYCIRNIAAAKNNLTRANILHAASKSYYGLAEYAHSLSYLLQSLTYLKPGTQDSLKSDILDWTSVMYMNLGDYESSLDYQLRAVRVRQTIGDSLGLAASYYTIADLHARQENLRTAINYFRRSLELAEDHEDKFLQYSCVASLANFYEIVDSLELCYDYSQRALELSLVLDYSYGQAYARNTLGNYFLKTGEIDTADHYFQTAFKLTVDFADKAEQCISLIGLAAVNRLNGRLQTAEDLLQDALDIALENSEYMTLIDVYDELSKLHSEGRNHEKAYTFQSLKYALKDSIIGEETRYNMENLRASFETEQEVAKIQDEKEAALLIKQKQLVMTYKIGIAVGLLLTSIMLWLGYARYRSSRKHFKAMKARNEVIAEQNEQLRTYNEDLQHFTYAISHDLREPLNHVVTMGMLIQENVKRKRYKALVECAAIARHSAERMLSMLTSLLNYARLKDKSEAFTIIDMKDIANEAINNLNGTKEERNAIIEVEELPTLQANKEHMILLLQNLIGNGLKYNSSVTPMIWLSSERKNGHWKFCVRDNGQGIDPKYYTHIFGMFNRVENNVTVKGSGMGLAMCRKIVERHKGKIWVESEPGNGSRFYFTIPAKAA